MITSMDIKQRILWLSDIHYLIEYKEKSEEFKIYLSSFIEFCKLKNEETPIDYILISGDIAQSGEEDEYNLFKEDILDKIFEKIPNAKLLVVPGNHDVSRTNISYFESYFTTNLNKPFFLKENPSSFDHIFQFYKAAFKDYPHIPKKASSNYNSNFFHGFLKDDLKKTIFVLLNSSWYSFGYDSLIHYIQNNIIKRKKFDTELIAKEITQRTQEYGNQIVGMNVFHEFDLLKNELKNYPEYFVITIMHHPLNWLEFDEQINYSSDNESPFFYLREKTNLLLTGHEHVPHNHFSDIQNNQQTIHIPAGPFIEVQKKNDEKNKSKKINTYKIDRSMFSILDINVKKNIVINNKFIYNNKTWMELDPYEFKLEKNYSDKLTTQRKNLLINKIDRHINKKSIITKIFKDVKPIDKQSVFFINDKKELFIFVHSKFNFTISSVKKVIKNHQIEIVNFIYIDVKYDNGKLYETENNKLEVLNLIKNGIEFEFNNYRHEFFSTLKSTEVTDFKRLKFVLIVKPFWEIEFLL